MLASMLGRCVVLLWCVSLVVLWVSDEMGVSELFSLWLSMWMMCF